MGGSFTFKALRLGRTDGRRPRARSRRRPLPRLAGAARLREVRQGLPAGKGVAIRILAREIAALVADSLAGNEVYGCLLTVLGIGPKTAAALVTSVDISMFRGHDEPAGYCGVALADSGPAPA